MDEGHSDIKTKLTLSCRFDPDELPILYSSVDPKNWTLVTSRGIWCAADNRVRFAAASDFTLTKDWAENFKGWGGQAIGRMQLGSRSSGETYYCPYHTGAQSMGTLYAVLTLFRISKRR